MFVRLTLHRQDCTDVLSAWLLHCLLQIRTPPPTTWFVIRPENLRSLCCGHPIHSTNHFILLFISASKFIDGWSEESLCNAFHKKHNTTTSHDWNSQPANLTLQWLQRYGWEILPHPAHSPDLAPSDFHLFGLLKRHLGRMAFKTEDDLISELRNWFDNLDVDFFRVGINSLLSRWQKCIDLHGDNVEK
ncbi:histone-lysine N-methyltransferase SETMAR [Plakobranchus ocellatus]|uniref:Histone-lysine N-methyltransferase SETMAR n=1 Tax=Plakobranchus ocellatus TaxID=259542 RepID=A0AAV4AKI3_9GAST|nr:histone-lysine N-methyltransferase SETMAR [Plakobranchus ocellatus]